MDNVIQFQTRKQKTEKTRQEIYEAEFQMQLDLITDRYNRMQKIKLVSDSDGEPTA